ncbi:MAG TPA: hypothetical protein VGR35_22260 [Tepidisphaeraceae bacterium]|nr:hypothetical protein [Tepidisphaeraceae bacterium]
MNDNDLRQLLSKLDGAEESEDARSVTKLLRLAVALNEWDYPCVSRIECGFPVQDAAYVGDIELLLSNAHGIWKVTVRPSETGSLVTYVDPDGAVDGKREQELKAVFERCGYVYMPPRLLREGHPRAPYATWFDRFFVHDYG